MKRQGIFFAVIAMCIVTAAVNAVAVLAPAFAWAQAPSEPERYLYAPHMGGGWYGMIVAPLFMVLVLFGVIAGVAIVGRWFGVPWYGASPPPPAARDRTPLDILKERFARGEIDKEEYEERRRVLGE
jgi:putative membrane protein